MVLSCIPATEMLIKGIVVFCQPDVESGTFVLCIVLLNIHRKIIMSHDMVTEIKKILSCSEIETQCAFQCDTTSKIAICLFIPPVMQERSPLICPILTSLW